jgi:hypothetical protein
MSGDIKLLVDITTNSWELFIGLNQTWWTAISVFVSLTSSLIWRKVLLLQQKQIKRVEQTELIRQIEDLCNSEKTESYCKGESIKEFLNTDGNIIPIWTICDIFITQSPYKDSRRCMVDNSSHSLRWDVIKRKLVQDYVMKYFDIIFITWNKS